jgi:hypothetical protein
MNIRRIIQRRFRRQAPGLDVQGDVNAVVAANVNERGTSTSVSSKQTVTSRGGTDERKRDRGG